MRREDFKIEGIPEGYRVYDVDLTPLGRPLAVLGHKTDKTHRVFVRWHGRDVPLPDEALWWNDHLKELLLEPIVRAVGEDSLVIVTNYIESSQDINARVWNTRAELEAGFHGGVDVEEVLAREDVILLFYGDQGQTGDDPRSREAMVVLSTTGEYRWGHRTQFGSSEALDTWFQRRCGTLPTTSPYLPTWPPTVRSYAST